MVNILNLLGDKAEGLVLRLVVFVVIVVDQTRKALKNNDFQNYKESVLPQKVVISLW